MGKHTKNEDNGKRTKTVDEIKNDSGIVPNIPPPRHDGGTGKTMRAGGDWKGDNG